MRYSRPADQLNPALDLGPREPFKLDLGDGLVSYPGSWPKDDPALGFTAYEPEVEPPIEPVAEDVSLTRFQLRTGLFRFFGVTADQVSALIASIPDDAQREMARISWEDADTYRFTHPLIGQIAATLQLPDEAVRAAWMKSWREEWR